LAGGVSFDGCDCWGLVRLYYSNEFGISLPAYTDFACGKELFSRVTMAVDMPAVPIVALIANKKNSIDHCGILLADKHSGGRSNILHSLENTGSVLSHIAVWQTKIRELYIWNG
jgi:cell wall-associated NlpC family hydrolase